MKRAEMARETQAAIDAVEPRIVALEAQVASLTEQVGLLAARVVNAQRDAAVNAMRSRMYAHEQDATDAADAAAIRSGRG